MFGLNNAQLIGRLGADVTVNHLANGGRVANLSIATDESYVDKNSGGADRPHRVAPGRDFPARLEDQGVRHQNIWDIWVYPVPNRLVAFIIRIWAMGWGRYRDVTH